MPTPAEMTLGYLLLVCPVDLPLATDTPWLGECLRAEAVRLEVLSPETTESISQSELRNYHWQLREAPSHSQRWRLVGGLNRGYTMEALQLNRQWRECVEQEWRLYGSARGESLWAEAQRRYQIWDKLDDLLLFQGTTQHSWAQRRLALARLLDLLGDDFWTGRLPHPLPGEWFDELEP